MTTQQLQPTTNPTSEALSSEDNMSLRISELHEQVNSLQTELSEGKQALESKQTNPSWKSRLSKFMELEGPVEFDSNGNASVKGVDYKLSDTLSRIVSPQKAAYDSTGEWSLADIRKYEGIRKKVALGVGSLAVIGGVVITGYLATKGIHLGFGGGSSNAHTTGDILANKPTGANNSLITDNISGRTSSFGSTPSSIEDIKNITDQVTTTIHQGDGVSQVVRGLFESKGSSSLTPDQMKDFIDGAIDKDLLSPKNVSGLVRMDVYGGYGFPGTGNTTFSPAFIDYMDQFRKTVEETTKAKS